MKFQGGPLSSEKMFLSIWLKRCRGFDHCKTEEQINRIASHVYLSIIVKAPIYEPDEYTSDFVKPSLQQYILRSTFGEIDKTYSRVYISEENIESDHKFHSFGFL